MGKNTYWISLASAFDVCSASPGAVGRDLLDRRLLAGLRRRVPDRWLVQIPHALLCVGLAYEEHLAGAAKASDAEAARARQRRGPHQICRGPLLHVADLGLHLPYSTQCRAFSRKPSSRSR